MVVVFPYGTCAVCEGGLPPGYRRRQRVVCDLPECREAVARYGAMRANRAMVRRQREAPPKRTHRCARCGEVKPFDAEHFYVDRRDPQTGEIVRLNRWCKACKRAYQRAMADEKRERANRAKAESRRRRMASETPEEAAERRRRRRESSRRYRKANRDLYLAAQRRYRERVKADPARLQAQREHARMAYRLRLEREGRAPVRARSEWERDERNHHGLRLPALPAAPLAAVLDRVLAAEQREVGVARERGDSQALAVTEAVFCERAGISDRTLRAWRSGQRESVQLNVADRVLVALDLLPLDVWGDDVLARLG